jgi:hypothetical protein
MGSDADQARSMAERIARRLSKDPSTLPPRGETTDLTSELTAMRETLSELHRRLGQIETKISSGSSVSSSGAETRSMALNTHSPWLQGVNAPLFHPSQEQFGVEEATVTQLVDFFQSEKQCTIEPGGKPCDHCAMCSSRGF